MTIFVIGIQKINMVNYVYPTKWFQIYLSDCFKNKFYVYLSQGEPNVQFSLKLKIIKEHTISQNKKGDNIQR